MAASTGKTIKVLVVDDERAVRNMTSAMLTSLGFHAVTAGDVKEALNLFHSTQFHMVITDFQMPAMNGGVLATLIKNTAPAMPVVMMTGSKEELIPDIAGDSPFDYLLHKPFSLNEFKSVVNDLLHPNTTQA